MKETIRKLAAMLDKMPEDTKILSIYDDADVFVYSSIEELAKAFGTEVITRDRTCEVFPFRRETTINGIKFYGITETPGENYNLDLREVEE